MLLLFLSYLQPLHPGCVHRSCKFLLAPLQSQSCWVWVGVKMYPGPDLLPSMQGGEHGGGMQASQSVVVRHVTYPK